MKSPMSLFGVGPWVLLPAMIWGGLLFYWGGRQWDLYWLWLPQPVALGAAGVVALLGISQLRAAAAVFVAGFQAGRLVTQGPFAKCRNPIYSVWIFWLIPSIALATRFWPILSASLVAYAILSRLIGREERTLAEVFGADYINYKNKTPVVAVWLF